MKIRIGIGFASVSGGEFAERVDAMEKLGLDSLWLSEQLSTVAVDPLAGMAYALGRTSTLKVGTSVAVLPGRNPVLLAKQLATMAALAPRRVLPVLGLGPARAADRSAFPVPAGRRGAVFDEALLLVRRLLVEESVTFHGEFFDVTDLGIGDRPPRPLDIWLGGAAPAALRRIGRLGDGWLASLIDPAEAAAGISAINAAAAAAGREIDPEHFGLSLRVTFGELSASTVEALRARRPDGDPAELVPLGWAAARDLIARYVAAGVSKFVIYPAIGPAGWPEFLDGFVRELVPLQT
ncbi:LLM class F420-dependent oxidoreductase [Frankia sp. CcI49]|uniref:TIGR03854 family LLM class F420-dependent oxidoreductase n=1 Tax=unclassified Frankia TaxID=2632575 RepID=UPI0006C9E723|nr:MULTISPECIES: TIGR03854 family LLM class F420-dependent oxidoreductase [unclassified Frankia]KPM53500.1 5,10-methylene tetrahydromethanopterin reductase [Frankia sp. R43]ONH54839.1 LLM class F420-dependent oxidoreductase [Frankia sp. CcI49]